MIKLNVTYKKYERRGAIMSYIVEEDNGISYGKGTRATYNVVDGVAEGLNRLLESLYIQHREGEAVTVTGVELTQGAQTWLADLFTSNDAISELTFE